MTNEDVDRAKLEVDQQRVAIERSRFELEKSFFKRYLAPFLGVLGTVVAGAFAVGQVWVAEIQRQKEVEIATLERDRRWKLDVAEFVFRNRQVIFAKDETEDQKRIFSVIAVSFPTDISAILLKDLRPALSDSQKVLVDQSQQLLLLRVKMSSLEVDVDRFGSDYKDFAMPTVEECSETCRKEPECKAFSFNKVAKQCWLKRQVPLRKPNPTFVSGVKVAG